MSKLSTITLAALIAAPLASHAGQVGALSFTSTVGGAPSGVSYATFDNLTPGTSGGVSDGITVSGGMVVQGTNGTHAAPFLSDGQGAHFGQPDGRDTTPYLTTGPGLSPLSLTFPSQERYMGLLWGSVDLYNSISFYNGSSLVGTLTGRDISSDPYGNQNAQGTSYVQTDITGPAFNRVVLASTYNAFEVDDVSYNTKAPTSVPEPGSLALLGTGLLGLALVARRKTR